MAAAAAVVAVVVISHAVPWIEGGFGYSLDGFNGAVWGQGARGLVEDPLGSRLGGIQPDGHRYANHPPLTVWATAAVTAIGGEHPVTVRLPALFAAAVTPLLLGVVLSRAGLRASAVVVGLVAGGTSAMALTYGVMLDTPVVSLPAGLVVWLVARRVGTSAPPSAATLFGAGVLAALAGWQALLLAGVVAIQVATRDRRPAAHLGLGAAAGALVSLAWAWWVHGSLRPLLGQAGVRSGGATPVRWTEAVTDGLVDMYGPVLLGATLAGLLVALVRRAADSGSEGETAEETSTGIRPLTVALGVTVAGYTLLFRNGAAVHPYWTFWGVALVAVAVAVLADIVVAALDRKTGRRWPSVILALGAATALLVTGLGRTSTAERRVHEGLDVLALLDEVPEAGRPTDVAVAVRGDPGTSPWAEHAVHGRAVPADRPAQIRRLEPDLPVVVVLAAPPSPALRRVAIRIEGRFALVRAEDLADLLGVA